VNPWRTLRGRLAAGMLLILLLGLAVSAALDRLAVAAPATVEGETTQDALVLAGFSLPALLLIWLIASWSLRPLARVSQEARRVGPDDPASRLTQTGLPAEIVPLVVAVNGALDRMADAFAAERRFTENAAHELRTPLAVLSLRLQRAQQDSGAPDWAAIADDLAQVTRLVGQMLDLARKENDGRVQDRAALPVVNLSRVAREACAAVLPMAEAAGRTLRVSLPETLEVRGRPDDLRDAMRNVLENAVLHGSGIVTLEGRGDAAWVTVQIRDEGAGLAPGQEQAVFERFQKDSRSAGSGLGLAIVREVVRSHGGRVVAMPGVGCVMEVTLPR
jgi:signal transduction histidine kinase